MDFPPHLPDSQNWTDGLYIVGRHEFRDTDKIRHMILVDMKYLEKARNGTHASYSDPILSKEKSFEDIQSGLIDWYTRDILNLKTILLNLSFSAN